MHGFDEAYLALVQGENHGGSTNAFAEETDALEKIAVGDTGAGKDHFLAGSEVVSVVDAAGIFDTHFFEAGVMFRLADHQAREDLAVEAAQRRCGKHAFRRSARAHDHVHAGANDGGGDSSGEVAVPDEANAGSGLANLFDEFFVARAIQNDDDEIFDVAIQAPGNRFEVIGDGRVELHGTFTGWADYDFFHV